MSMHTRFSMQGAKKINSRKHISWFSTQGAFSEIKKNIIHGLVRKAHFQKFENFSLTHLLRKNNFRRKIK